MNKVFANAEGFAMIRGGDIDLAMLGAKKGRAA
jgi:acyl CoA:acetate/3-ketoacid CoA transferase beta subunit